MKILYCTNKKASSRFVIPDLLKKKFNEEVKIHYSKIDFNKLKKWKIDFIITDRYPIIVESDVIKKYRNKIINFHNSLLPKCAGWLPIFQSIRTTKKAGVTFHKVANRLDAGPILLKKKTSLNFKNDTLRTVYEKQRLDIKILLAKNWVKLKNSKIKQKKQNLKLRTIFYKKDTKKIFKKIKNYDVKIKKIVNLKI